MDNETADKILTQLQVVHNVEQIKFDLLRLEEHSAAKTKELRIEIENIVDKVLKLQANGIKKMQKGGDDV